MNRPWLNRRILHQVTAISGAERGRFEIAHLATRVTIIAWGLLLLGVIGTGAVACSTQTLNNPDSSAQGPAGDWRTAVNAHVTEQMQRLGIPGAAIGIVRGKQIEYLQGYGTAGDNGRPVTPQTPFYLASLSKAFTAAAVVQLAEARQLELDAPVQRYLPWFRVADAEASAQLTVRHLLAHISGFSEVEGYTRNLNASLADDALEKSFRAMRDAHLLAAPGARYEYSNTNYDLLGLLVAVVSGESYESYIQRNIFEPLAMKYAFTSPATARSQGMASSYYPYFGKVSVQDHSLPFGRGTTPSSGLVASAEDLTHWLIAHLNQGRYLDARLVSPAGMALLHTAGVSITDEIGYAMGWVTFPFSDLLPADASDGIAPIALTHSGRWLGYATQILLVPEREIGVVVLMNMSDGAMDSALSNIGWNVGLIALGLPPKEFPLQEDWLAQHARALLLFAVAFFGVSNLWLLRKQVKPAVVSAVCLVQITLAAYLFLIRIPEAKSTLPLMLRFEPDLGQMSLVLVVLAGWSVVRVIVTISQYKKDSRSGVRRA
jgi:CubicO group peptidase (beta-lactamase class C family)